MRRRPPSFTRTYPLFPYTTLFRSRGTHTESATLPLVAGQRPVEIASRAMQAAKLQGYDVLILDTAGRLHVDQALMDEMKAIADVSNPAEILLVVDSLTGQDAVNVATSISEHVALTSVVLHTLVGGACGGSGSGRASGRTP